MGSENIGLSADPTISKAYYKLLHAAIEVAELRAHESVIHHAATVYARSLSENVKQMDRDKG